MEENQKAVVIAQLRAIRNNLEAAAIAAETALAALDGPSADRPPGPDEPGIVTAAECKHEGAQDASVMGTGPTRAYCRTCRNFVYPDGRTEPAEDVD